MNEYFKRTKKKLVGTPELANELSQGTKFSHFMLKFDGTHAELIISKEDTKFITREGNDVSHLIPYLVHQIDTWEYREAYLGVYACELIHLDAVDHDAKNCWSKSRNVLGRKLYDETQDRIQCVIYDVHTKEYQDVDQTNYLNRRKQLPNSSLDCYGLEFITRCIGLEDFVVPKMIDILQLPFYWHLFMENNNEGVVCFNLNKAVAWDKTFTKVKPLIDVDCVVMGFNEGTKGTKNEGRVGSINVGLYKEGKLIPIGKVPHMNEEEREYWTTIWLQYNERATATEVKNVAEYGHHMFGVIQVECAEITTGFKLRFPNYVRLRTDKKAEECVWSQIL